MTANPSFARLNASDLEHLLMTLERALEVQTRAQFFLWAQGALQGFIAHESLWCAHGDIDRMQLRVECFSNGLTSERVQAQVTDRTDGLLPRLVDDWIRGGRIPRLLSSEGGDQVGRRQLISDLKHCGFDHVAVHGVREVQGSYGSFFVLAGLDHVRVAHGRDFGDVSPLRGVIQGGGSHNLHVGVTVAPVNAFPTDTATPGPDADR